MSDESPGCGRVGPGSAAGFSLLTWLFLILGVAHAAAAVAGLLPGRAGPVAIALDVASALAVAGGLAAYRWGPGDRVDRIAPAACVLVVALAAVASGVRGATAGQPWFGADVVLAVLAAVTLPGVRSFAVAVIAAVTGWAAALAGGFAVQGREGAPAAGWVLLAMLAASAVSVAAALRSNSGQLRAGAERAERRAGLQAVTDPLTGASNRRGLERHALPMIEHARRQGEAVHCLFVDVDEFRVLNERLGRAGGDGVLTGVHAALLASIRATDVVARWSGDQFVVLGPGTGTSPLEMERRVRGHLSANPPVPVDQWAGAVSIGSATLVPWDDGNLNSLLGRAEDDMRLRRSLRRQGRARAGPALPRGGTPGAPASDRRSTDLP